MIATTRLLGVPSIVIQPSEMAFMIGWNTMEGTLIFLDHDTIQFLHDDMEQANNINYCIVYLNKYRVQNRTSIKVKS